MLLGLCGYKNCGKDTVGGYLVKEHNFERKAFADKLKESASALFDVPVWQLEKLKNDIEAYVEIGTRDLSAPLEPDDVDIDNNMTVRSMLQRYGTEAHRDIFGEDFWVDQLLPVEGFYGGRAIVVTDVRFVNEIDRIVSLGGRIVFIDRPALDYKDPHRSESEGVDLGKQIGYHLMNDGTLDDLFTNVEKMLSEI